MLEITILKVWIIGILISSIIHFFSKKKLTVLSCGIFGFNGNLTVMNATVAKLAQAKLKMLGMYNVERGKHSCGIYIGDQIYKGVNGNKVFTDFIAKQMLPDATESGNYNIIGHTRAATHGSPTEENAHPFIVDDNFVLAHNGVIRNIWNLCSQYKVDSAKIYVDSLGLAHLISQNGWEILEKYEGFAALLMAFKNEPNTMYIYRGESPRHYNGKPEEERPLFYLKTEEGMYFSSMETSLMAISDSDKDDFGQVEGSTVLKVENGEFANWSFKVDRGTMNHGVWANTVHASHPNVSGTGRTTPTTTVITPTTTTSSTHGDTTVTTESTSSKASEFESIPAIWFETLPARISRWKVSTGIIYQRGRWWIVNHDEIFLANGAYFINKKGRVFVKERDGEDRSPNHWFLEGILMKNLVNFNLAKADPEVANPESNFARVISKYAMFPVCNSKSDVTTRCRNIAPYVKYRWFQNGAVCGNIGFTPRFSDRHYTLKDGLFHQISGIKNLETTSMIDRAVYTNELQKLRDIRRSQDSLHIVKANTTEQTRNELRETIAGFANIANNEAACCVNQELPFKQDEKVEIKKGGDLNLTNFHRPFDSIENALSFLTPLEQRAIRYYVCDVMNEDCNYNFTNVYQDNADLQFKMFLAMCAEKSETIFDNWNDEVFKDISTYLIIASENEDGVIYDEVEEIIEVGDNIQSEDKEETCEYVPKPVTEVQARKLFRYPEDAPVDEESPIDIIDDAIARQMEAETSEVPEVETWRPVADATFDDVSDKDYAFEEAITSLLNARDEADNLTADVNSDFSQEVASAIYRAVDPLLRKLTDLTEEHNEFVLNHTITKNIKLRVNS